MPILKPTADELATILADHHKWLAGDPTGSKAELSRANLSRANLSGANLSRANLSRADLSRANLWGADLSRAELSRANLSRANLWGAHLSGAELSRANLSGANLSRANLSRADLSRANLWGADLWGANLSGANLSRANLSAVHGLAFQIPQEGELIVFKKLGNGSVAKLRVPPEARRTASMIGRKCRAEFVEVLDGNGPGGHDPSVVYKAGETVRPDSYDDDPKVECTSGIHFFLTREEAEAY